MRLVRRERITSCNTSIALNEDALTCPRELVPRNDLQYYGGDHERQDGIPRGPADEHTHSIGVYVTITFIMLVIVYFSRSQPCNDGGQRARTPSSKECEASAPIRSTTHEDSCDEGARLRFTIGFRNGLIPMAMYAATCASTFYAITTGILDVALQTGMKDEAFQSKTDEPTAIKTVTVYSINDVNCDGIIAIETILEDLRLDAIAIKSAYRASWSKKGLRRSQGPPHVRAADKHGGTCGNGCVPSGSSHTVDDDNATPNHGLQQGYATGASDDSALYKSAPFWLKFGKEWSSDVTGDGPCQLYQEGGKNDEWTTDDKARMDELQREFIKCSTTHRHGDGSKCWRKRGFPRRSNKGWRSMKSSVRRNSRVVRRNTDIFLWTTRQTKLITNRNLISRRSRRPIARHLPTSQPDHSRTDTKTKPVMTSIE